MLQTRTPAKSHWFVPLVVAVGMVGFLAWQLDWIPFDLGRTETGTLLTEDSAAITDAIQEFQPGDGFEGLNDEPVDVAVLPNQFEPEFDNADPESGDNPFAEFAASELPQISPAPNTATALPAIADNSPPSAPVETSPESVDPFTAMLNDAENSSQSAASANKPRLSVRPAAAHATGDSAQLTSATAADSSNALAKYATETQPHPQIVDSGIDGELAAIDALTEEGDYLTAHARLSKLYWHQPAKRELFHDRIELTAKSIYAAKQPHYLRPYVVKEGDQLRLIARKYNVPWQYLAALNRVDERRIRVGQKLKVNRGPFSALIDLSDFEMTIHAHGYYVHRYPVGIGREGTTPLGQHDVLQKLENPTYYGPDGTVIEADDPENPLGEYWIDIGDSYGIHGTIDADSVGEARSRGCIRLRDGDITEVYNLLSTGSPVVIRR